MRFAFLLIVSIFFCCSQNKKTDLQQENLSQADSAKINNAENIALLIDTSITMLSPDFEPTRIKSVVAGLRNMINSKKENQFFSIIVFSGNSYLLCPLTSDKDKLLSSINEIEIYWKRLRAGTNIPEALLNAAYSLKNTNSEKSILIFSDGATNVNTYSLDTASDILREEKIRLNTIIISPKDYEQLPTKMYGKDNIKFEKMKVKSIDRTLIEISSQTNGLYKIMNSSQEINNFNFQNFIKESMKQNSNTKTSTSDSSTVSKIFSEIEASNKLFRDKMKQKKL